MTPGNEVTGAPLRIRIPFKLIWVTEPLHRPVDNATIAPGKLLGSGGFAVMRQLMVWSPQLAGLMPAPGLTVQGRMSWGPMRLAAWVLGWAVTVIVWPLCGAGRAD